MKVTNLMEAEVIAAPPELKIRLKSNDKLMIPKELIVVAEYLCKHKRKVTITNNGKTTIDSSSVTDSMSVEGYRPHVHDISSLKLSDSNFTLTEGEIEFLDELKKGDKVMVATFEGGQKFFIMDRLVTY